MFFVQQKALLEYFILYGRQKSSAVDFEYGGGVLHTFRFHFMSEKCHLSLVLLIHELFTYWWASWNVLYIEMSHEWGLTVPLLNMRPQVKPENRWPFMALVSLRKNSKCEKKACTKIDLFLAVSCRTNFKYLPSVGKGKKNTSPRKSRSSQGIKVSEIGLY